MSEARKAFWEGVRTEFPLLIGVFPFGMIYGALALKAGLSTLTSQMMSAIVFAGSSQFVIAQLVHDAAPTSTLSVLPPPSASLRAGFLNSRTEVFTPE